jgi:O-succinylbenzoic acid--CoA ligase
VYDGVPIGNAVVRTVEGQLEISGSMLAEGYLADEDLTGERFVEHDGVRWYRTGDLGAVAADGTVSVTGRADNVIISGGEKVSLDAVELRVRALPGLGEACVVRAADAVWGEVPVVVVAVAPPGAAVPGLEAVRSAVAAGLGPAARPARIVTVPALPLLASGKPDRRALQALVRAARPGSGQAPALD